MTTPVWLIAEREFHTYVATLSFWLALAIGPLAMGAAVAIAGGHAATPAVTIRSANAELTRPTMTALQEAGRLEGRYYSFASDGGAALVLARRAGGMLELRFSRGFPLSPSGRALVARVLERDAARRAAHAVPLTVHENQTDAPRGLDAAMVSRIVSMMLLWLTLTGSLGMLLQTVVRERANRVLESLLAAAQSWQIVTGKIVGVGAVSLLVLAAWLGSAAMLSFFQHGEPGLAPAVLAALARPVTLARDTVIYLSAYAFYGSVTVALGAMARDSAAAQNLSRPMFVVLMAGFFIALSGAMGNTVSWLVYLPPVTPFLLLIYPPGTIPPGLQAIMVCLLLAAAAAVGRFAACRLTLSPVGDLGFRNPARAAGNG